MDHRIAGRVRFCRQCGLTETGIIFTGIACIGGSPNVVHLSYVEARRAFKKYEREAQRRAAGRAP